MKLISQVKKNKVDLFLIISAVIAVSQFVLVLVVAIADLF